MLGLIVTSFSCRRFLSVSSTYGFVGCDASVGSLFYEIFTSANVRDFQSKRVNACTVLLQSAYAFFGVCCRVASAKAKRLSFFCSSERKVRFASTVASTKQLEQRNSICV